MNGTQLHYMKDTGPAKPGDLVVMDAATEYEGYAADITRTIPVSGRSRAEQQQIYQLVRDAQAAAERNSKPGMSAGARRTHRSIVRAAGLAALGLIEGEDATFDPPWPVDCARQPAACKQSNFWMIHGISHGLGLAVHDPAQFSFGDRTYKVGDAFTIEPGHLRQHAMLDALPDTPKNRAFIAKVKPSVARYENTGVRIEDDYVITDKGLERISTAPREIAEIEALMKRRARVQPERAGRHRPARAPYHHGFTVIESRFALNSVPGFHCGIARGRDGMADLEERLHVLHTAAEVPVGLHLVRRLVIVVVRVLVALLHAVTVRFPDVVDARIGVERRHALLGELEMVRAVVEPLLRLGVGTHGAILCPEHRARARRRASSCRGRSP